MYTFLSFSYVNPATAKLLASENMILSGIYFFQMFVEKYRKFMQFFSIQFGNPMNSHVLLADTNNNATYLSKFHN